MDTTNPLPNQLPNQPPPFSPPQTVMPDGFQVGNFQGLPQSTVMSSQTGQQKKNLNSKNFIVIGVLLLVLSGLILGFNKARSFLSKAAGGCQPANVAEENLTQNSVEIVFQTDKVCQTEIAYGTSSKEEALLLRIPEALASLNHRIRLSPLLPATGYYYQIIADGEKTEPIHSFLTGRTETVEPTVAPVPVSPTVTPSSSIGYTITDFEQYFGISNAVFDIDKNGVVNIRDWILYQKTKP